MVRVRTSAAFTWVQLWFWTKSSAAFSPGLPFLSLQTKTRRNNSSQSCRQSLCGFVISPRTPQYVDNDQNNNNKWNNHRAGRTWEDGSTERRRGCLSLFSSSSSSSNRHWHWDGDDLRYWSRLRRRLFRRSLVSGDGGGGGRSIRNLIMVSCIVVYLVQTMDTLRSIVQRYPQHWPYQAPYMLWDVVVLANYASPGPVERAFCYHAKLARVLQPHRYLTYGFLHRGILHLYLNLNELRRQPAWLETGLGGALYWTTFLGSLFAGCWGLEASGLSVTQQQPILLGVSSGICGLYGLMWVSLAKMKTKNNKINPARSSASYRALWGMGRVLLYTLFLEGMSNVSHIAGFAMGIAMGIVFGPSYSEDYAMRRKWSTQALDTNEPREYRAVLGFGIKATPQGLLPVALLWILALAFLIAVPTYRSVPAAIARGIWNPKSYYY